MPYLGHPPYSLIVTFLIIISWQLLLDIWISLTILVCLHTATEINFSKRRNCLHTALDYKLMSAADDLLFLHAVEAITSAVLIGFYLCFDCYCY